MSSTVPRYNANGVTQDLSEDARNWNDLAYALEQEGGLTKANKLFKRDGQLGAFTTSDAIMSPITFGIKSSGSDSTILVTVSNGMVDAKVGHTHSAIFTLSALPFQWREFFKPIPPMPYQSYWGMFGMNIKQSGIEVLGSNESFAHWTHVWRRVLELLREAYCGSLPEEEAEEDPNEDHLVGRYVYVSAPIWGKCKLYYEQSGEGNQNIVFLHTAGSDSRQYHGVMNDEKMRKICNMVAFDLPGHGRSFPSRSYHHGEHTNTENAYVGCIAAIVKALKLEDPIICGASMAGQVCLAVAARYQEVGAFGTIPLQGCDHLNMPRNWHDRSPYVNQALFNPEWVYGMMSPTAPAKNKALLWHIYSSQAYGVFHGDLDFYFGGWDGRSRMPHIDTSKCPVYMLNGEYDWSNTPGMSQATADKIPGAKHKSMEGLGHFPATENPQRFIPYLIEAIEHIQKAHGS